MVESMVAAGVLIGAVAFWAIFDQAFQRRVKRLFYGETTYVRPDGGRWAASASDQSVRTWIPGSRVVYGAGLGWDQKMAILRRHQRIGLLVAVLVLVDLGYSIQLFRSQSLSVRSTWAVAGPRLVRTASPSDRPPRKLWSASFGGYAQAIAFVDGFALVRDYGLGNSGLYLMDRLGRVAWAWEPADGGVGALVARSGGEAGPTVAVWDHGGRCHVFQFGPDALWYTETVQENPPPMMNEKNLGPPLRLNRSGVSTDRNGRYRVTSKLSPAGVLGIPVTTVIFYDDGPTP